MTAATQSPAGHTTAPARLSLAFLAAFGALAVGIGAGRAITTTYIPVLLDRIQDSPGLIGAVMMVNAVAGFGVPLLVGLWSDRAAARSRAFIAGGSLVTAGGLVAVALGTASSYVWLAIAAAAVYAGLNATATVHRALVADRFADAERPAATSAQELAMLAGGLLGVLAGGALIAAAAPLLFAAAAAVALLAAVPTVAAIERGGRGGPRRTAPTGDDASPARPSVSDFIEAMRRPRVRGVLVAQILWVMAYAALPAFIVLYAGDVLDLGPAAAGAMLAAFGLLTAAGMVAAGRTPPERVHRRLVAGAALLGGGLVTAAPADTLAAVAVPFAAAAFGAGIVTALGFPYFARFVPAGSAGRYTGLYFSVRAIASAVALPVAGLAIAATGSYRVLMLQGAAALVAIVPLARTGGTAAQAPAPAAVAQSANGRVGAVVPCYSTHGLEAMLAELAHQVDRVVIVDDGTPEAEATAIERAAERHRASLLRLEGNRGKGVAVAAGASLLLQSSSPPGAVLVIDADGQHPPDRIPAFIAAAAYADVVVGDRSADRGAMPWTRRCTNRVASALLAAVTRRRMPDSQCGMRLFRAEALAQAPLPPGRYEAETTHLKRVVAAGLEVAWVPIPAIYDGSPSAFRPLRDSGRVLRAIATRAPRRRRIRRPSRAFAREWTIRLGVVVAGTLAVAAVTPLAAPLDYALFRHVNSLGAGPGWVYEALDPHTRNYVLAGLIAVAAAAIVRPRRVAGALVAVAVAGLFSDLLVQAVYLLYDRPRPEELLPAAEVLVPAPDRTWAHIASFPSGHVVVTTAIVAAAVAIVPALRAVGWTYVVLIALTRITFGAHFPLDVAAGLVFGYVSGTFAAGLSHALGLLPVPPERPFSFGVPGVPRASPVAGTDGS